MKSSGQRWLSVLSFMFFCFTATAQNIIPFKQGNLWGIKRSRGEIILKPSYNYISTFDAEGRSCFYCTKDGRDRQVGMIDTSGKIIVECRYYMCINFRNGYAVTELKTGKKGMVDFNGRLVLPPEYDEVQLFSEGKAMLAKGKKYGYINEAGTLVIPLQFDSALSFRNNRALVMRNGMYGYIDGSGREVIPFYYQAGSGSFANGLAIVKQNGKYGVIDTLGKIVAQTKYDYIAPFGGEQYTRVNSGSREGYIDLQGNEAMGNRGDYCFTEEEKKTFRDLKAEILLLNSCDSAGHIDRKVAIAKARAKGYEGEFKDDVNDYKVFPYPYICMVMYKGICCWKITTPSIEHSNEGECAHTNGCTVFVDRSILIDARFGKIISETTERSYTPNYE